MTYLHDQARELSNDELRRHASVSTSNRHYCNDCFCCACVDVLKERNGRGLRYLECACCGNGFRGTQHYNRDTGYGVCASCGPEFGYHTEGPQVTPVDPSPRAARCGVQRLDTPEHVCNATQPICECGRRWEWAITDSDGTRYTSNEVRNRYVALYGQPHGHWQRIA